MLKSGRPPHVTWVVNVPCCPPYLVVVGAEALAGLGDDTFRDPLSERDTPARDALRDTLDDRTDRRVDERVGLTLHRTVDAELQSALLRHESGEVVVTCGRRWVLVICGRRVLVTLRLASLDHYALALVREAEAHGARLVIAEKEPLLRLAEERQHHAQQLRPGRNDLDDAQSRDELIAHMVHGHRLTLAGELRCDLELLLECEDESIQVAFFLQPVPERVVGAESLPPLRSTALRHLLSISLPRRITGWGCVWFVVCGRHGDELEALLAPGDRRGPEDRLVSPAQFAQDHLDQIQRNIVVRITPSEELTQLRLESLGRKRCVGGQNLLEGLSNDRPHVVVLEDVDSELCSLLRSRDDVELDRQFLHATITLVDLVPSTFPSGLEIALLLCVAQEVARIETPHGLESHDFTERSSPDLIGVPEIKDE